MLFDKKSDRAKSRDEDEADAPPQEAPSAPAPGERPALDSDIVQRTVRAPVSGRPKVMSITIKDRKTLHAAYMPFLHSGGIFVPGSVGYDLGDEVFLLLKLLDAKEDVSIPGAVVWVTPEGAMGGHVAGIGVQFTGPEAPVVRTKIEGMLGGALKSRRKTHTM